MKRGVLTLLERVAIAWEGVELWAEQSWTRSAGLRARLAAHGERIRCHPLSWGTFYVSLYCALSMLAFDRPVAAWLKATITGEIEGFSRSSPAWARHSFT